MSTHIDDRQVIDRSALNVVDAPVNTALSTTLPNINTELNVPLRMAATFPTADANLNFQPAEIGAADGAQKSAPPIGNVAVAFPVSTVNFQLGTTTGGTFLPNSGANTIALPTSTVGFYIRVGFSLLSTGQMQAIFSAQSATVVGLANPGLLMTAGGMPVGWIDLQAVTSTTYKTAGSTSNIIENAPGGTATIGRFVGASSSTANQAYPTIFVASQTALISALSTLSGTGGVICLTSAFPVTSAIVVPSNIVLLGRNLVSPLTFSGSGQLQFTGGRSKMYDMYVSTTANITMVTLTAGNNVIERCRFSAPTSGSATCLNVASNANDINDCEFNGVANGGTSNGINFALGFAENTEENNIFTD
jgi:hypothetical protein